MSRTIRKYDKKVSKEKLNKKIIKLKGKSKFYEDFEELDIPVTNIRRLSLQMRSSR